jgi:DNA topoisomerase I
VAGLGSGTWTRTEIDDARQLERHVSVSGNEIVFRFRAKNRRLVRRTITSAKLARAVEELLDLPNGSQLLRFEREGELVNLTSDGLNAYLSETFGDGFSAKDFRTWGGTLLAAVELERRGPPSSEGEAKRVLAAIMRKVGHELGNTAAVTRASYVSPRVINHYLAGQTVADFRSNGTARKRLTSSEHALLRLLAAPVE